MMEIDDPPGYASMNQTPAVSSRADAVAAQRKPIIVDLRHSEAGRVMQGGTVQGGKPIENRHDATSISAQISYLEMIETMREMTKLAFDIDLDINNSTTPGWTWIGGLNMILDGDNVHIRDETSWKACRALLLQDHGTAKLMFGFSKVPIGCAGPEEGSMKRPKKRRCVVQ